MTRLTSLAKLRVPLGGQEIELQQLDHDAGGMSLLRTRIREASRFTVFDIDPQTATEWGRALLRWADAQPKS
jgi:Flp pilus assembly CpaE family ATPase